MLPHQDTWIQRYLSRKQKSKTARNAEASFWLFFIFPSESHSGRVPSVPDPRTSQFLRAGGGASAGGSKHPASHRVLCFDEAFRLQLHSQGQSLRHPLGLATAVDLFAQLDASRPPALARPKAVFHHGVRSGADGSDARDPGVRCQLQPDPIGARAAGSGLFELPDDLPTRREPEFVTGESVGELDECQHWGGRLREWGCVLAAAIRSKLPSQPPLSKKSVFLFLKADRTWRFRCHSTFASCSDIWCEAYRPLIWKSHSNLRFFVDFDLAVIIMILPLTRIMCAFLFFDFWSVI